MKVDVAHNSVPHSQSYTTCQHFAGYDGELRYNSHSDMFVLRLWVFSKNVLSNHTKRTPLRTEAGLLSKTREDPTSRSGESLTHLYMIYIPEFQISPKATLLFSRVLFERPTTWLSQFGGVSLSTPLVLATERDHSTWFAEGSCILQALEHRAAYYMHTGTAYPALMLRYSRACRLPNVVVGRR